MKQFFKMMFASALGVFVAIILISVISVVALVGTVTSMSKSPAYTPKANTVFKIKLEGTMNDQVIENPLAAFLGNEKTALSLNGLLKAIQKAKTADNINGIYIEAGMLSAGPASLEAVRKALIDFKESGKFVIAYSDFYTQGCYFLCSVADKIFMNPQGALNIYGLASQTLFYTETLNKIGVKMQVFKVGTYKGAVEPFTETHLSDANREQINSYIGSIWNNLTAAIAESRKMPAEAVNQFANEGLALAKTQVAVENKFVDELKYKSEVEKYVMEQAGQSGNKLSTVDYKKINTISSTHPKGKDKIAILFAEGEITQKENNSPYDMQQAITEKTADALIKLKNDASVKAVVLRVNSPGGSAYISEQIWKQVAELKKAKPIVVSMGDVAASGGYYISCAANKIVAEPNTLTGSIGIFGLFPNATGLFDKIALTSDIVKTNTFADLGDITRPMREDEKALLQTYIERGYDTFISRCAEGRGMTKEAINKIGQGRVWTGTQALEIGLVDELGGIDKAVQIAGELADLSDYMIEDVSTNEDLFTTLLKKQLKDVKLEIVKSFLGEDFEKFATLHKMKTQRGILTRLPYDIKPM